MKYQFRSLADCGGRALPQRDEATLPSPIKRTHRGLPSGINPLEITDLLEPLRGQLGLRDEDLAYLRLMLRKVRRDDFQAGRICAVWETVTGISDALGMLPRQINRIEQRLLRAGLIAKTSGRKGNRFGRRTASGVIEIASGINFAPLIDRMPEIVEYHRAAKIAGDQLKTSRRTAADLIAEIRSLGEEEAIAAARSALPRLRPSEIKDLARLEQVIEALEAVLADFSTCPGQTVETAQSDSLDRPYTNTKNNTKICTTAKTEKQARGNVSTTPAQVRLLASVEFAEIMAMYLEAMEPGKPLSWPIITLAAHEFAQINGFSSPCWTSLCQQIGQERAALCLLLADHNAKRTDGYQVQDIPSAVVGMVRAEARGKAVIEALIAELG